MSRPGSGRRRCGTNSAPTPKVSATNVWPRNFIRLFSPRLRCLRILMKSSRKPTRPIPVVRYSSSSADAVGPPPPVDPVDADRDQVADPHRDDDRRAAHGRRAALLLVVLRAVLADLLAEALLGEHPDQVRGEQDRRPRARRSPRSGSSSPGGCRSCRCIAGDLGRRSGRSATRSRPADRDALTSTTSPVRQLVAQDVDSGLDDAGTSSDSPPHDPSRWAPRCRARAPVRPPTAAPVAPPGPCTTISRSMPSRTTSRPISSCAAFVSGPSSAISPSTAQVPPAAADGGQRPQRGLHRVRVGVVGVVDQR